MSNNKKIRNRLDKLFSEIKDTEHLEPAPESKNDKRAVVSTPAPVKAGIFAPAPATTRSDSNVTYADPGPLSSSMLSIPFQAGDEWNLIQMEGAETLDLAEEDQALVRQIADQLGLALQNAKLFQATQQAAEKMAAVAEITSSISTMLDPQALLQAAVDMIQNQFGLYHAHIFLVSDEGLALNIRACGWEEGDPRQGTHGDLAIDIATSPTLVARAAREKETIVVNDTSSDPNWIPNPILPDIRAEMAVPVISGEQLIGVLNVHAREVDFFSESEASIMTTLAAQIGGAIQNAFLVRAVQKTADEVSIVNTVVSEAASSLDLSRSLNSIIRQMASALSLADVSVALTQTDGKLRTVAELLSEHDGFSAVDTEIPVDAPVVQKVLQNRQTLVLEEPQSKSLPLAIQQVVKIRDTQTLILLPIFAQEQAIGLMTLHVNQAGRKVTKDELRLAETIVTQASIAIQNARLYQTEQYRRRVADTLSETARQLSAQTETIGIAETVYRYAGQLIDVTNFFIGLYQKDRDELYFPTMVLDNQKRQPYYDAVGNGLTRHVINTGKPLLIPEKVAERTIELGLEKVLIGSGAPSQSWLGVPMNIGNTVLGVVVVQSDTTPNLYGEQDLNILVAFANQAAIAFQNANSFQQTQRQNRDLSALNDLSRALSLQLTPTQIAERTYEFASQIIDCTNFFFAFFEPETEEISFPVFYEHKKRMPSPNSRKLGKGMTDYVIRTKQPLLINGDMSNEQKKLGIETIVVGSDAMAVSWLGAPLVVGETVIGVIAVQSFTTINLYTDRERDVLSAIASQVAIAIQNTRLFENTQKSLSDLELINRLTSAVSGSLDMTSSLQLIAEELQRAFNIGHVGITLFNQQRTHLVLTADAPLPTNGKTDIGALLPLTGNKPTEQVIETKKPLFIYDVLNNPLMKPIYELMKRRGTQNMMIFPLLSGNEVVGTVGFDTFSLERTFSDSEVRLVETILFQVASAIRNSQLFAQTQASEEALRRQNEYLATATEVGRLITSTLDMAALFSRTVELIKSRFGYYHVAIFTVEESGFNAVLREGTGSAGEEMKNRQHSLPVGSKSVIGTVTQTATTVIINNTAIDPIHKTNPLLPDTRAEAGIPLKIGTRILGALDIQATEINAFQRGDIAVLETLADQIAVAIDNARSYDLAQKAVAEMREIDRIKSQFLANMSHELRTPLNSIIGFSRVILKGIDGPITEQQQQDLSAIYNSGQHLLGLINDILDLSKIEAGKMELAVEELNIGETINSVMSTAVGLVKDKPIKLKQDIAGDLPTVRADPMRIRQVLLNLISNASKFTEEGSITVNANVHVASNGQHEIMVSVTDTGPGISPEDQKKLFQAFSQVDSSATRKTGGTGLGLSISHRLVQMHGGKIGVHSTTGKGSTFYFTIPLYHQPAIDRNNGEGRLILCIDDDVQIVSLYERYLRPQGYRVMQVANPLAAKDTVKQLKPYAVTLDIMMPEMDGWSVLEQIKSDPETRNTPVIVCSIVEEEERGFSLGAADYLVKPIMEEDLLSALNRLNGDGSIKEVLIIDDTPADLRLMEKIVKEHGPYRVSLADNGDLGWQMIIDNQPHAVILDLFMPGLDGFSILERLRTNPELRDLPVIVVSGVDLNPEQKKQLDNLGKHLLQKGMLNENELFATLEKALKRLEAS